ncbi:MAG: 6-phosphofructokinase [Candidatus Kapaibacterium sp.]
MKFAVLTGGGDCSGMNAFVRGVVRCSLNLQPTTSVHGVIDGWKGLVNNQFRLLGKRDVAGHSHSGGTILGTVRVPELARDPEMQRTVALNLHNNHIDYLFVCGGNGSVKASNVLNRILREEKLRPRILVCPGSIDNDVCNNIGTSIGFYSALDKSLDMLEWIRDTASSHRRVYLIQSMGRDSAYLAFYAGIVTGAEYIIRPGEQVDYEALVTMIDERDRDTRIIVAEGYEHSLEKITEYLDNIFAKRNIKHEIRSVDMSYFQRGGKAAVTDILRASWLAYRMVCDALAGKDSGFYSAYYTGHNPDPLPLDVAADDALTSHQDIPQNIIDMALALR